MWGGGSGIAPPPSLKGGQQIFWPQNVRKPRVRKDNGILSTPPSPRSTFFRKGRARKPPNGMLSPHALPRSTRFSSKFSLSKTPFWIRQCAKGNLYGWGPLYMGGGTVWRSYPSHSKDLCARLVTNKIGMHSYSMCVGRFLIIVRKNCLTLFFAVFV